MILDDVIDGSNYVSSDVITFRVTGFHDDHSGLDQYEIGIGSRQDVVDVVPTAVYRDDVAQIRLPADKVHDGHTYYIITKAVNRAGLTSQPVSRDFILDVSPPTGGHVMDGHWLDQVRGCVGETLPMKFCYD